MMHTTGLAELHPNPKRPNGNGLQASGKPADSTPSRMIGFLEKAPPSAGLSLVDPSLWARRGGGKPATPTPSRTGFWVENPTRQHEKPRRSGGKFLAEVGRFRGCVPFVILLAALGALEDAPPHCAKLGQNGGVGMLQSLHHRSHLLHLPSEKIEIDFFRQAGVVGNIRLNQTARLAWWGDSRSDSPRNLASGRLSSMRRCVGAY
jgi:hypothetical protein